MRTLMELVRHGRLDVSKLITHRFAARSDRGGLRPFAHQRDGVVKVAITP